MSDHSLTIEAKARLFDRLAPHRPALIEAIQALAQAKASALIISHKAGFRAAGRGLGQADFGLESLSGAHEILTGLPLPVDQIVQGARMEIEGAPADEALA